MQKVLWTLGELGIAHEQVDAGRTFGIVESAEYRARNPNCTVPTFEQGDLQLWESNAIVRYLAATYGVGDLWSEDPAQRALSDRWMDWADTGLRRSLDVLFVKAMMKWAPVTAPNEIDQAIAAATRALAILSPFVERGYVAGDQLTIGDIPLGILVNRWFALSIERPPLPAISAYLERLAERPAFRAAVIEAPPVL